MKKIGLAIVRYIKLTDKWLWLFAVMASTYGLLLLLGLVYSDFITMRVVFVQALAVAAGTLVAIIVSAFDYHFLARMWKIYYPLAFAAVILTFFIGISVRDMNDKTWIPLPMGMTLQPSELLKLGFILTFAYHLEKVKDQLNAFYNIILLCVHGAVPVLLIHYQGDDGTALIFLAVFFFMLFSAGLKLRYVIAAVIIFAVVAPMVWMYVLGDFQKERIMAVVAPQSVSEDVLYQQLNARIAMSLGGVWGTGLFSGSHRYIPVAANDFIFAFAGEAVGFVGCLVILLLLFALSAKIIITSTRALDGLGRYICMGVFAMIVSQTMINVGMCISVFPVIGITLPFFSAGGTSLVVLFAGIGLVQSVAMHNNANLFIK